jgi:hypothetical protein
LKIPGAAKGKAAVFVSSKHHGPWPGGEKINSTSTKSLFQAIPKISNIRLFDGLIVSATTNIMSEESIITLRALPKCLAARSKFLCPERIRHRRTSSGQNDFLPPPARPHLFPEP